MKLKIERKVKMETIQKLLFVENDICSMVLLPAKKTTLLKVASKLRWRKIV